MTNKKTFSQDDIIAILAASDEDEKEKIRSEAEAVLLQECGPNVYMRGLVEISNACRCDCLYCGIRKSNREVNRYSLSQDDILKLAKRAEAVGYGSLVLQSGERKDKAFIDELCETVKRIKDKTKSDLLPHGLGITLCVGEQTEETYQRFFEAGAHRYLLRIETTNPTLFQKIHPPEQTFETRHACLRTLKKIGYQVGTGVMIGLPDQTLADLANDVLFFKDEDIDMIGMGPFIPHKDTPLRERPCPDAKARFELGLAMIAATRLVLRDVNIAATTALQALDPLGRERALRYGANVMMPLLTPEDVREEYQLYPGKPYLNESAEACRAELAANIEAAGRKLCLNVWGDAPHTQKKRPIGCGGGNGKDPNRHTYVRANSLKRFEI